MLYKMQRVGRGQWGKVSWGRQVRQEGREVVAVLADADFFRENWKTSIGL